MLKEKEILNLGLDTTNEQVETALLNVCTKNKKLTNFIKKFFAKHKDRQINAYEDYGWEWDVECYDKDSTSIVVFNQDFNDWEITWSPIEFSKYFHKFNWNDITLDNGKILLLMDGVDDDDNICFQIFDMEKLVDGAVDALILMNNVEMELN
jgi:hypothetical protein